MSDEPEIPPPQELWMLWSFEDQAWVSKSEGVDDPEGGHVVCMSLCDAAHQACYQHRVFNVVSTPIRVK